MYTMSAMEVDNITAGDIHARPRRARLETQRVFYGANSNKKTLQLEDVLKVLAQYADYEGGINCAICGKLYKSRVCFIKHIWEHSVYWDLFEGEKNHDRVLSIQAALILYNTNHQVAAQKPVSNVDHQVAARKPVPNVNDILSSLLVTSPHEKKKDINNNEGQSPKKVNGPTKRSSPSKSKSPSKRRRSSSASSTSSQSVMECSSGTSDNELPK